MQSPYDWESSRISPQARCIGKAMSQARYFPLQNSGMAMNHGTYWRQPFRRCFWDSAGPGLIIQVFLAGFRLSITCCCQPGCNKSKPRQFNIGRTVVKLIIICSGSRCHIYKNSLPDRLHATSWGQCRSLVGKC